MASPSSASRSCAMSEARCEVCPRRCLLSDGALGFCGARRGDGGSVVCDSYGIVTSLSLDPVEKKPLAFFYPGRMVLSVGSYGCNMRCPFCQNHAISDPGEARLAKKERLSPEELLALAKREVPNGNIGAAYTYNEALIGYEYVRDCAALIHGAGMKNVLVTNGMASQWVLDELLPYVDAMNVDLKAFRPEAYERLGGDLETVKAFIEAAAARCHVEITSLIVPGLNDDPGDMQAQAEWIAGISRDIPLHITRYFPRHKMAEPATDVALLKNLADIAKKSLRRVLLGNV